MFSRWLALLLFILATSGCAGILGLDSGGPLPDDAGAGAVDDVSEASVSSDAAIVDAELVDGSATIEDTTDGAAADSSTLSCPPGKADCNGDEKDGCETNINDPMHCGSCTNQCPAMTTCVVEVCCGNGHAPCKTGSDCCNGTCDPDGTCH